MGNAKTALKITADGFHANKDYWYVKFIILICMSCPAAQNAFNKDFSSYLQIDYVHPMSVGHIFFYLFSVLTLFRGKVWINIKYLITQSFRVGQVSNQKDGRKNRVCRPAISLHNRSLYGNKHMVTGLSSAQGNNLFQRYRHLTCRHYILFALFRPPLQCEPRPKWLLSNFWGIRGGNREALTEFLLKAVLLLAKELAVLSTYCKEDWAVPRKKEKEQYAMERKHKVLAFLLSKYLKCKES